MPNEIHFNEEETKIVDFEVEELLKKGAIVPSEWECDQFLSNIFVVKKPNGKFRPIINLKALNKFVHYEHFKQEHFKIVLDLVQENDYFCSIDLQDAYFSVPIHHTCHKYLKFQWRNEIYSFVVLPFGYSAAPRIFTKLLKPIYAWFRSQGIRCSFYIDDSLNMNKEKEICLNNCITIHDTLQSLGYKINEEKSVLIPTQNIVFFGFILDSVAFMVYLTEEKIEKIILKAKILLEKETVTVRELASFIGSIINAFYAVLEAPLHYRQLERCKISGLENEEGFDSEIKLDQASIIELHWWINNIYVKNGKRIRPEKVVFTCQTDASKLGWGCFDVVTGHHANGRWSRQESRNGINFLELLAVWHGIQSLYNNVTNCHIKVFSDNISAVAYINDIGGMLSLDLDNLAIKIWNWCLNKSIFLSACYVKGSENIKADYYSRHFSDNKEWMLKKIFLGAFVWSCFYRTLICLRLG